MKRFITISNINLVYLVKNPEKENIVFFIHGNSISSRSWNAQLNSELLKNYRLIAIDLPAHGDSDAVRNPVTDYSVQGLGAIIAAAIHSLAGKSPYMVAAISLGTNILAESLAYDLQPEGIVLAGSCLVGGKYTLNSFAYPETNVHVVFTEQAPENEVRKYASQVMKNDSEIFIDEFMADYYLVKSPFRSALMNSIQEQQFSNEIELVASVNNPILMIFGKEEQIINPDYLDHAPFNLWNNTIYKIPNAGHLVHSDQPEEFNRLLSEYAADIFGT